MIIGEIIWQLLEEAGFLWTLRGNAVASAVHSLEDLARLDNRVEAHIDGLRVAADEARYLWENDLAAAGSGRIFVASVLAFEADNEDRIQ